MLGFASSYFGWEIVILFISVYIKSSWGRDGGGGHVETEREDFKDNNEENQARMEASDETSKKGCCQVESWQLSGRYPGRKGVGG